MGERASVGVAAIGVLFAMLACKAKDTGEFAVVPGVEPRGTCAVEGYVRGDRPAKDSYPITIVLSWTDPTSREIAVDLHPVTATEHRWRVDGLACDGGRDFGISAYTDDHRAAVLYSSIGGNSSWLHAKPGDRLTNVRLDLQKGTEFTGTVKDASGAPIANARVAAVYANGGDAWSPPREFTATDAKGEYVLYGVEAAQLADKASPKLAFWHTGYDALEASAPASGGSVNAVLTKK